MTQDDFLVIQMRLQKEMGCFNGPSQGWALVDGKLRFLSKSGWSRETLTSRSPFAAGRARSLLVSASGCPTKST